MMIWNQNADSSSLHMRALGLGCLLGCAELHHGRLEVQAEEGSCRLGLRLYPQALK